MKRRPYKHLTHLPSVQRQPIVFFTAATFDRKLVLGHPGAHEILRGLWERSAELNGWYVGDYLLMPDHVHFFAQPRDDADPMGQWVKAWKSISARQMIKAFQLEGPIWQDDYFDRYLRSGESYNQKWQYVRGNPMRAGLVQRSEDWPFQGRIFRLEI